MEQSTRHSGWMACLAALAVCTGTLPAVAAVVWDGPPVSFLKTGADPTTVQDVLTAGVSLTRANSGILFNPLGGDAGPGATTPTGTLWAFDTDIGNPSGAAFGAASFAELTFLPFLDAVGGTRQGGGGAGVPNVVLDNAGVLYLVDADAYVDIQFLQWTSPFDNPGSAVEYLRGSPIPLPASLPLAVTGLLLITGRCRRHRSTPRPAANHGGQS